MQPAGSGSNLKDDRELSMFKKKKIKTLRRDPNEDGSHNNPATGKKNTSKSVNKKINKAKEKYFAEIQSQGSFESLKSGFGVQGLLEITNNNRVKDSARSEMDKYQITRLQIAKQEKQRGEQVPGQVKGILLDPNRAKKHGAKKKQVVFADLPDFKEEDEQAIINKNRKKYKKDREQINIHRLKKKYYKF